MPQPGTLTGHSCSRPAMARSQSSLPRGVLFIAFGALLALLALPGLTEAATATGSPDATKLSKQRPESVFSDVVHINGKEYDVADPDEDPNESDSVQQDSTAEWQTQMVEGLLKQRKAEKAFMDRLEIGGRTLEAMVLNITAAFGNLEKARQEKGRQLIKAHFTNEAKLLKQSQQDVVVSLSSLLTVKSTDSTDLKFIKQKVLSVITAKFSKQIADQTSLFKAQMEQIEGEHKKQTANVRNLFDMIASWKNAFRDGLKRAAVRLEEISEQWDML